MRCKVAVQRFEVGVCALTGHESQLHQLARCVIDEDQQRAGLATAVRTRRGLFVPIPRKGKICLLAHREGSFNVRAYVVVYVVLVLRSRH
jgi:hypothetical protein